MSRERQLAEHLREVALVADILVMIGDAQTAGAGPIQGPVIRWLGTKVEEAVNAAEELLP